MKSKYLILTIIVVMISGNDLWAQFRRAERLYRRYEYTKAIPYYERVANRNKKHSTVALVRLGDIYRMTSNYSKASEWYQKAVAANGVNPEVYLNYGQVLRSQGKYQDAITQFEKYMSLNPNDTKAKLYTDYCRQFLNVSNVVEMYDIFNVKGLNTAFADFSPVIYKNEVVFASDRSSGTGIRKYGWTGAYYLDLYKAEMPDVTNPDKELTTKPSLFSNEINSPFHDGPASFTADDKTVLFTRVIKKSGESDTSKFFTNKLKIFSSDYDGKKWSDPIPFYLNSDEYSIGHPAITPDGSKLYFASDMPGGNGGTDLYSVDLVDGKWSNLKNLGPEVNTFGNEMFPFVDSNGSLYFASDGWPGLGSMDILKTTFIDGKWLKPENLKEPVNSSADDFGFFKSKSGLALFSSNRAGGVGGDDIYMASGIKFADSVLVAGLVKDRQSGQPLADATVLVWNMLTDDVNVLKTNGSGEYSLYVKPGASYVFKSVKRGYTTDCLNLTLPKFVRETTHDNSDLLLVKLKVNEIFRIENIFYDFDKWNIRQDASVELDKLVSFLNQNMNVTIELGSHTDCRGSDAYNIRLSDRRAESAVSYIVSRGISKDRITAKGYGEKQLVNECADNVKCSEEAHQANRRTEIKITGVAEEGEGESIEPLESLKQGQKVKLTDLKKDFFSGCAEGNEL
ncbi:MAG: OmpA family protein [Lentimicrobiaceae bacterium]